MSDCGSCMDDVEGGDSFKARMEPTVGLLYEVNATTGAVIQVAGDEGAQGALCTNSGATCPDYFEDGQISGMTLNTVGGTDYLYFAMSKSQDAVFVVEVSSDINGNGTVFKYCEDGCPQSGGYDMGGMRTGLDAYVDPDLFMDRLPQPYRMLDNILNNIIDLRCF